MDTLVKILGIVTLVVLMGLVLSLPIFLLWNSCLVPAIDGTHQITWLQAWGLNILCVGLFKNSVSLDKK